MIPNSFRSLHAASSAPHETSEGAVTTSTVAMPHLRTPGIHFRTIVLAVDLSWQSDEILRIGLQIAASFSSRLVIVHAVQPATPAVCGPGAEPYPIDTFQVLLEESQALMAKLLKRHSTLDAYSHREVVAYAAALDLVRQVATNEHADLVITGSHGAKGIERLALGSTAESILHCVSCPVLIVGPKARPSARPFAAILLATDLSCNCLRGAQYAAALAEHFHSPLTLCHVTPAGHAAGQSLTAGAVEDLRSLLPVDFSAYAKASILLEQGDPAKRLPAVATNVGATLVVAGARPDRMLADHSPWSTLAAVIRSSPCPVLCVKGHLT